MHATQRVLNTWGAREEESPTYPLDPHGRPGPPSSQDCGRVGVGQHHEVDQDPNRVELPCCQELKKAPASLGHITVRGEEVKK